jgi:hypothetical protein
MTTASSCWSWVTCTVWWLSSAPPLCTSRRMPRSSFRHSYGGAESAPCRCYIRRLSRPWLSSYIFLSSSVCQRNYMLSLWRMFCCKFAKSGCKFLTSHSLVFFYIGNSTVCLRKHIIFVSMEIFFCKFSFKYRTL